MQSLLATVQAIAPVSNALVAAIRNEVRRVELSKRKILLREGELATHIYFIEKGLLRGYYWKETANQSTKDITTWIMKENDFVISIIGYLGQKPSVETIEALEDAVLWSISHAQMQKLYDQFPEFNRVGRLLTERYYVLSEWRSHHLRLNTAEERYRLLVRDFPTIFARVAHKHIASLLGVSAETLSRIQHKKS
jgi:CRP/FNR family transcriptional regulator, anaerobic regulatory protein